METMTQPQTEESPYIPTYYREQGITAAHINIDEQEMDTQELDAAREDVAARLERLARRVRQSPVTEVAKFDEAYSEIIKLASALRPLLQLPAPGPAYKG